MYFVNRFKITKIILLFGLTLILLGCGQPFLPQEMNGTLDSVDDNFGAFATSWRSKLYPADWKPGIEDSKGRYLHDFSYAGYHRGEIPIPNNVPGKFIDVTKSPYNADNRGGSNASLSIQAALDDVGKAGGGVVYLPAGTYKINKQKGYGLAIRYDGVVLRGAGRGKTFLYIDEASVSQAILVEPNNKPSNPAFYYWLSGILGTTSNITRDLMRPTRFIPVATTSHYKVGDWVMVRTDVTAAWVADFDMSSIWGTADTRSKLRGATFISCGRNGCPQPRRIKVSPNNKIILVILNRFTKYIASPSTLI